MQRKRRRALSGAKRVVSEFTALGIAGATLLTGKSPFGAQRYPSEGEWLPYRTGEIERCIARHPDVEQSVVVAVGNSQHRRLVAFAKLHDRHRAQALQAKEAEAAALAQGIIVNPAQRLAFKLKEPHIRALDGLGIALTAPADSTRYIKRRSYRHFSAQKPRWHSWGNCCRAWGRCVYPVYLLPSMPMRPPGAIPGANLRVPASRQDRRGSIRYLLLRPATELSYAGSTRSRAEQWFSCRT